ncbi:MAG: T9SS type A sorting domain-containing protein [Bacteroidetes bacterium]|nr:T9SS type A sorting domain-containing protein [Bacteroidota bacterium]
MKDLYSLITEHGKKSLLVAMLFAGTAATAQQSMRANLYAVASNTEVLLDGNLTEYASTYSNTVDYYDALKLTNFGSNFGISRDGYDLVVERRATIKKNDTTAFRMWNMAQGSYRIKFILNNLENAQRRVIFQDTYLRTQTEVSANGTTPIDFSITTDPASASQTRFRVIHFYRIKKPIFLAMELAVKMVIGKNNANLQWNVTDEDDVTDYVVEHSKTGSDFSPVFQLTPHGKVDLGKNYEFNDADVAAGDHYYRIKATTSDGNVYYSEVAKVKVNGSAAGLVIYPNPVLNKTVYLQFNNLQTGKYEVSLINGNGIRQFLTTYLVMEGQGRCSVKLPSQLAPGNYMLEFSSPGRERIVRMIYVQ